MITLALGAASRPPFRELSFTHATAGSSTLMDDLYGTVADLSNRVPHGVIVFFSSYAYMERATTVWTRRQQDSQGNTATHTLMRKPLFIEQRGSGGDNEPDSEANGSGTGGGGKDRVGAEKTKEKGNVFAQYARKAVGPSGALLCCVMNGKLSEGINFSDNLARCVIVVGLPYPNKFDVILQEKMSFMRDAQARLASAGGAVAAAPSDSKGKLFASQIYENMCMRAINQSIGRSIRHIGDYSAIVVLDRRYCSGTSGSGGRAIVDQLPKWTTGSGRLKICSSFSQASSELTEFYETHGYRPGAVQR